MESRDSSLFRSAMKRLFAIVLYAEFNSINTSDGCYRRFWCNEMSGKSQKLYFPLKFSFLWTDIRAPPPIWHETVWAAVVWHQNSELFCVLTYRSIDFGFLKELSQYLLTDFYNLSKIVRDRGVVKQNLDRNGIQKKKLWNQVNSFRLVNPYRADINQKFL